MWVKVLTSKDHAIFVAICYFPSKGSRYNMVGDTSLVYEGVQHGPSPYKPLLDDIIQYSSQGEVFLIGDFNARTQSRQCTIFQILEMVNVDPLAIGITRRSKDQGAIATSFGHHLLELGS